MTKRQSEDLICGSSGSPPNPLRVTQLVRSASAGTVRTVSLGNQLLTIQFTLGFNPLSGPHSKLCQSHQEKPFLDHFFFGVVKKSSGVVKKKKKKSFFVSLRFIFFSHFIESHTPSNYQLAFINCGLVMQNQTNPTRF